LSHSDFRRSYWCFDFD